MKNTLRIGTKVNVLRSEMASSLVADLPSFIFYNAGKVAKVADGRVMVRFNKEDKFWFDSAAVTVAEEAQ